MAEWTKAPVLKTGDGQPSVGSNPTPSATAANARPCFVYVLRSMKKGRRWLKKHLGIAAGRVTSLHARFPIACPPKPWRRQIPDRGHPAMSAQLPFDSPPSWLDCPATSIGNHQDLVSRCGPVSPLSPTAAPRYCLAFSALRIHYCLALCASDLQPVTG